MVGKILLIMETDTRKESGKVEARLSNEHILLLFFLLLLNFYTHWPDKAEAIVRGDPGRQSCDCVSGRDLDREKERTFHLWTAPTEDDFHFLLCMS